MEKETSKTTQMVLAEQKMKLIQVIGEISGIQNELTPILENHEDYYIDLSTDSFKPLVNSLKIRYWLESTIERLSTLMNDFDVCINIENKLNHEKDADQFTGVDIRD